MRTGSTTSELRMLNGNSELMFLRYELLKGHIVGAKMLPIEKKCSNCNAQLRILMPDCCFSVILVGVLYLTTRPQFPLVPSPRIQDRIEKLNEGSYMLRSSLRFCAALRKSLRRHRISASFHAQITPRPHP
jgi:hypothetical protein